MIVTLEISLYPLDKAYKQPILDFIKSLHDVNDVSIHTTEMSTYIKGEWSKVMSSLEDKLGAVYKQYPASATVIKIIPQDLPIENGFRSV